jgi:hypothetical protein
VAVRRLLHVHARRMLVPAVYPRLLPAHHDPSQIADNGMGLHRSGDWLRHWQCLFDDLPVHSNCKCCYQNSKNMRLTNNNSPFSGTAGVARWQDSVASTYVYSVSFAARLKSSWT